MAAKSQLLARTFDADVREKDAELAEAERVAELESMRRQAEELRAREVEQMGELVGSEFGEEDEERVLSELVVECEGLVQEEAGEVLREMIAAEEAKLGLLPGKQLDGNGDPDLKGEDGLNEHFRLAHSLLALHGQRQGLLSRIVANLAMAGYRSNDAEARERKGMYKKLIEGALMVRGEEVEGLLPEMLRDLEEGGAGGGAGGFS
ncbi:Transcription factor mbp1 [Friedmanniomyces endolithicus]|nr:Transcription factor mbp1 [Friedmanniomyces endolithicus]